MEAPTFISPCQRYGLVLSRQAWRRIVKECNRTRSVETGGILIGHYTSDLSIAFATEATGPPPDSCLASASFERGAAGLQDLLASRWNVSPRTHYLGEWHYHPAKWAIPSEDDILQMNAILADHQYQCAAPVMLIVARAASRRRVARAWVFTATHEVELERQVLAAGAQSDLARATAAPPAQAEEAT